MIDWSKYPKLSALDSTYLRDFKHLIRDVRRAERERCADACSKITGQHIKAERTMRTIEERTAEIAQGLGAAECRSAIDALVDEN